MLYPSLKNIKNNYFRLLLVVFFLGSFSTLASAGIFDIGPLKSKAKAKENPQQKKGLSSNKLPELQAMARAYRQQGLVYQKAGNLTEARSNYEKAILTDPFYVVAFNDLGVVAETEGNPQEAEGYYLRCIQIDPEFMNAYSNLALLYEGQRDLKKAASFWEKRIELGSPQDPWTEKARKRLSDINLVLGKKFDDSKEREISDLAIETADQKALLREDDTAAANAYFEKAKKHYQRGDITRAHKEAIDAMQLDPNNRQISDFVDKLQLRLLSR